MKTLVTILITALLLPAVLRADEGMWTYNNFPKDKLQKAHGVNVDDPWLDHLRLSSVRLAQGCSASFVSPDGLVMTNHHCAHIMCLEQVSTADHDYVKNGFYAKTADAEPKCPEVEVNQLVEITDVTPRMREATQGLADQKYNETEKAEMSRIEKECAASADVRCDVVSLYRGGAYDLYKYRRFQDVRLVMAPELQIAFFGGDPDNFNFPRYDLDVAFLRVYQNDKPAHMDHYLHWSPAGTKEGDVTFVSGNPGSTRRQLTISQLEYARDVQMPERLLRLAEFRGLLTEYQRRGPEQKRHSTELLFSIENSYKASLGEEEALRDHDFFAKLVAEEDKLRKAGAATPEWQKTYGSAWDQIAQAQQTLRALHKSYNVLEGQAFYSDLFGHARTLLRASVERGKPLQTRFREYRDSAIPAVTQRLFSDAPIYDEFEIEKLTFALIKLREDLGADDPVVHKILGAESPEDLATRVVKGTKLKDVAVRKALWEGGESAVAASTDPMIELARKVDPDARAVRKRYEDEVEAPVKKNAELLAKLKFAIYGTSTYPDATFTPRVTYGVVRGWTEPGRTVAPYTVVAGVFERATGRPPFDLPESWLRAKGKLNPQTPFNFVTDNDIIGGNSGSPVVNAKGELVGLIFDGNIHSLGGDFGFDESKNRAVAVDSRVLIEALEKVYGADRLVGELRSAPAATSKGTKKTH